MTLDEYQELNVDKMSDSHNIIDFKKYLIDQHLWSQNVFWARCKGFRPDKSY